MFVLFRVVSWMVFFLSFYRNLVLPVCYKFPSRFLIFKPHQALAAAAASGRRRYANMSAAINCIATPNATSATTERS